jgi:NAD(P) transhydrogenase subunit alpha
MSRPLLTDMPRLALSLWVGFEVISKVPPPAHPADVRGELDSRHQLVSAMLIAVTADNALGYVIAFVAAAFAAMNVVGGYVVTGRMLKMFRRRSVPAAAPADGSKPAVSAAARQNGSGS